MAITRLKNIYSSNTGRILYVSPDDFDASDAISNRGNSPLRPFKTLQRALLEASRYSYVPGQGGNNDRFDQFTILLQPGDHVIDNRPGISDPTQAPILSDNSNFDLRDPNNDLYKFNSTRGGVIVPRGTSIVGLDLRKTKILPKFIPDPTVADTGSLQSDYPNTGNLTTSGTLSSRLATEIEDDSRSAIFRVTGGCYFWQFTFFDGDPDGVYTGSPNPSGVNPILVSSNFSHHKLTNFEYACFYDLSLYYQKATRAFSQAGIPLVDPLGQRVEENRIVGPGGIQADITRIQTPITFISNIATATTVKASDGVTRVAHGFSIGNQVRVFNAAADGSGVSYNGTYQIIAVSSSQNDNIIDQFSYQLSGVPNNPGVPISGGGVYLSCELETDTVDSASPYIFNISIRSTYGLCGMHANGAMAAGFKSMVVAQYTGICLQKDDRAFVRACPMNSDNYQDGTITTCSGVTLKPAHQDINSQYKKGWRNYHIKASNDGYIQVVSVFAVGFADQFLVESGGDMSIANSDSNFGNTALRAKGYKSTPFTKDISGVVTHILPPANVSSNEQSINWLPLDIQLTRASNGTRLYVYGANDSLNPPITNILGYTLGARTNDSIFIGLNNTTFSAFISPSGPATRSIAPGQNGSPILWDSTANNWYLQVSAPNTIYTELSKSVYSTQIVTPTTYFNRITDSRTPSDKLYRLRLYISQNSTNASPPQNGFVIHPLNGKYNNAFYIYNVETYQPLITTNTAGAVPQDGIYYLTVLLTNISPTAPNFSDNFYSQNVNQLYPTSDIDNITSDAYAAKSVADNITIGLVNTTNGTDVVTDRSITKEALIFWCKETSNAYTITDNSPDYGGNYNYWDVGYSLTVNGNTLTSYAGGTETRLIDVPDVNVELRRPSIIRAGNQTFEYNGFGPGNYSTAFPSKQTKVLSTDDIILAQSKKENGGIVFYSGLNANGDLFVGNSVINPITGSTTPINKPITNSATDPNSPIFTNVTITKALTVIGGSDNNSASTFYGPVSFYGKLNLSGNLEVTSTWNNPQLLQTGIKLNVNNISSPSTSKLIDLQISGNSLFNVDSSGTINGNNLNLSGNFLTNKITVSSGSTTSPAINFSTGSSTGIYSPTANSLAIVSSSKEVVRISSNSNVGIGTTSPTQKLDVSGNIKVSGGYYDSSNGSGTTGQMLISTGSGTSWRTISPNTQNLLSFLNDGTGAGTGATFNGANPITVSYNTIGAASTAGIGAGGTWNINIQGNAGTATTSVNLSGGKIFDSTNSPGGAGQVLLSTGTGITWGTNSASTPNSVTFTNTGLGANPNSTFNGGLALSVSYNTIGSVSAGGTGATGTWDISIKGTATNAVNLAAGSAGKITDKNNTTGSNGQLLSSTGTGIAWVNAPSTTGNLLTFRSSGGGASGAGTGTTFNGASAIIVSYNTIGAASTAGIGAGGTWKIDISGNAATATNATNATYATSAGSASSAGYATSAGNASTANSATSATTATSAGTATTATNLSGGSVVATSGSFSQKVNLNGVVTTGTGATIYTGDDLWINGTIIINDTKDARGALNSNGGTDGVFNIRNITSNGTGTIGIAINNIGTWSLLGNTGNTEYQLVYYSLQNPGTANALGLTQMNGQIKMLNNISSTSTTTGTLVVSGGVGIAENLNVGGDITAFLSSDARLKDKINPIKNALDKVDKISGNTFVWNEKSNFEGKSDVGVIAQEIKEVLPEVVTERDNGYLAVQYEKLVPLLIQAIKELREEVRELKK